MRIDVSASGAVILDKVVSCDGFISDCPIRVQTHVHKDHMSGFNSSIGVQHIIMSNPTRDLLINEFNAVLPNRSNFVGIPLNQSISHDNFQVRLLNNGHMLGSVQVEVISTDGLRCGYSGDFTWPLEEVIEVEELVLDSTYGSPDSVRKFSQEEANNRFVELVIERLNFGPILILAHRGTLQRAISYLDDAINEPIIASSRLFSEWQVYQKHGYGLPDILDESTQNAKLILSKGKYIRLFGTGDPRPTDTGNATSIKLSAYMSRFDNPVVEYSEKAFCIALSDHADYNETLAYVHATQARRILTDNSRGKHAVELALALKRELGVDAQPSENKYTREWGK
ncbi:hypothetical protein C6497_09560 [Candidatus Poribacteria bacterium]|nr:MAG: hypothetical protein C6497_09560 [Candidatus Poribacteria bacterium]